MKYNWMCVCGDLWSRRGGEKGGLSDFDGARREGGGEAGGGGGGGGGGRRRGRGGTAGDYSRRTSRWAWVRCVGSPGGQEETGRRGVDLSRGRTVVAMGGFFLVENILHCIVVVVVVVVAAVYTDGVCTGCGGSGWGAVEEVDWAVCARNWVGGVKVRVRRQWNDSTSKRINSTFNSCQCSSIKRHEACVRPNQAPAGRH